MLKEREPANAKENEKFEKELELWRLCAEGDENAREQLVLSYRPMVYWLAKKIKVNYTTYPDLVQEGMVALINAVDAFDLERNNRFSTYAYYKIKGRMINFMQRVEAKAPLPVDDDMFDESVVYSISVASDAGRSEWGIDLERAMASLSEREADIVSALIVEGQAAKEVADKIKVDVSHVYRIRRKAVAKLRAWLSRDEATSST